MRFQTKVFAMTMLAMTLSACNATASDSNNYPGLKGSGYIKRAADAGGSDVWRIQINQSELKQLYPQLDKTIEESDQPADPSTREELVIEKRHGQFFWASNGDKPLVMHKAQISLSSRAGGKAKSHDFGPKTLPETSDFFVFSNPGGEGLIIVEHIPPIDIEWSFGHSCSRGGWNYIEYRLNDRGSLSPTWGRTDPFPYPKHDNDCIGLRDPEPLTDEQKAKLKKVEFGTKTRNETGEEK